MLWQLFEQFDGSGQAPSISFDYREVVSCAIVCRVGSDGCGVGLHRFVEASEAGVQIAKFVVSFGVERVDREGFFVGVSRFGVSVFLGERTASYDETLNLVLRCRIRAAA